MNFSEWLAAELEKHAWSQAELARRANVSQAAISNILNGRRNAGEGICRSITRALQLPPETVFRAAGLLPPAPPVDARQEKLLFWLNQLDEASIQFFERLICCEAKHRQRPASGQGRG